MARSSAKRIVGTMLFFLAVLLTLSFVFLLYARAIQDDVVLVNDLPAVRLVTGIVLGVIAIVLFVMLFTRRLERQAEVAEDAEVFFIPEPPTPQPTASMVVGELAVYDLRKVPLGKRAGGAEEEGGKRLTYYFPINVEGGVFVNDYIPIGSGGVLKLRTLMGGPTNPAYALDASPRRSHALPSAVSTGTGRSASKSVISKPSSQGMVLQEVQTTAPAAAPTTETYFDYPGDNHEVEDLEGIGPTYGERLRAAGVHTSARLTYEESGALAEKLQLPRRTVDQWKMMAELVKVKGIGPQYAEVLVRSGVEGIAELKRRSPTKVADQVNAYLDTLDVNVVGTKITAKRVEGWQDAAKSMKRIRLKVPAQ